MKTAVDNSETISLDKIAKNTNEILQKINRIRPSIFVNDFKLSNKAKEEKDFILKNLFPKTMFSVKSALETFTRIIEHTNLSKLEKADQDFIVGLEKTGFKNSLYIKEISDFITNGKNAEIGFSTVIEETLYFSLLNSELNAIESRLLILN